MPFKRVFERNVNRNMQEGEQDQTPHDGEVEAANLKKLHESTEPDLEEEDQEQSEKKDRPPRFSTLFAGTPPPPQVVERYIEPKRKGVYLPTPLFVVLAFILFFESTLLFAYTIIGLYNNMPAGVLPFGGPSSTMADSCNCAEKQAAINFAPNFYMGPGQTETGATTSEGGLLWTPNSKTSSTSTSTTSIFTTSTSTTKPKIVKSTKVVTKTPEQKTVDATINLTVNAAGSTLPPAPTVTSTTVVAASSSKAKKRASIKAALHSINEALTPDPVPSETHTTLVTSASPTDKADKTGKTTSGSSATGGACYGGSGAVGLVCPDGVF